MIPAHERKILEAYVLGIPFNRMAFDGRTLNEYEQEQLKDLIKLRLNGIPIQYLTGTQEFYGREFYVNTSVLVPRPETELLVEKTLTQLSSTFSINEKLHGLDFGTGSGCIGITLALERFNLKIHAVDCSQDALDVAVENTKKLKVSNIDFIRTAEIPDLQDFDTFTDFDFIVSNPPYLQTNEDIASDVLAHEPHLALFAPDKDPLYFYRFLSELMHRKLKPSGFAYFEIAENRGEELLKYFEGKNFKITLEKDLTDRHRFIKLEKKKD